MFHLRRIVLPISSVLRSTIQQKPASMRVVFSPRLAHSISDPLEPFLKLEPTKPAKAYAQDFMALVEQEDFTEAITTLIEKTPKKKEIFNEIIQALHSQLQTLSFSCVQCIRFVFWHMQEVNVRPDIEAYRLALDAVTKLSMEDLVEDILREVQHFGIEPNAEWIDACIRALVNFGKHEEAADYIEYLQERGIAVDEELYKLVEIYFKY